MISEVISDPAGKSGGLEYNGIAADSCGAYLYNPDNNLFIGAIKIVFPSLLRNITNLAKSYPY